MSFVSPPPASGLKPPAYLVMFFHSPLWFLLLIPFVVLVVWNRKVRVRRGIVYSDITVLKQTPQTLWQQIRRVISVFPYMALLLLIVALARPQAGREDFRVKTDGIAILMCIDRSGSMQAIDFRREGRWMSRLEAVKITFREFVLGNEKLPGRANDLIGLIAFGGFVDSVCPLTLDHFNLVSMLESIQLAEANKDALGQEIAAAFVNEERLTAIGDALVEAVERIKDAPAKSKVIILLSDGEQTAGITTPIEGAFAAKAYGIKIYTIGIGTTGTAAFIERDPFGKEFITYQPVTLDQRTLMEVARDTGGRYFNAQNIQALEDVYSQIDNLEKTELEGRQYTKFNEYYVYCLWPSMGLLLVYVVTFSTRLRMLTEA